jgi:4'-phosphopantetheinyl transferase
MSNPVVQINHLDDITWQNKDQCNFTINNSADVWRIRISAHVPLISKLWLLLNADEQERANRYYREQDKQRFIVSRAGLRVLLGKYTNQPPQEMEFEIGDNKKPRIKNSGLINLHYNISHSGNYVLVAVADSEVGIDVEKPDPNLHYREIMDISFSPDEINYVETLPPQLESFYTLWTRKEALLKATAKGIDDGLKFIPAVNGTHTINSDTIGSEKSWIVSSFKVDPDHIGCLACTTVKSNFRDLDLNQIHLLSI